MLLRIVFLFPCVSAGLCATLGLFHMQAKGEDAPAQDTTNVVVDGVIEAVDENTEVVAASDNRAIDPSLPGDEPGLLEKLLAADKQPESDKEEGNEVNAPIEDGAPAEEEENMTGDVPVVDADALKDQIQVQHQQEEDNKIKPIQTGETLRKPDTDENSSRWSLSSIRNSFQSMHGYFDSLVELVGGRDGVCQYRCRYGELPAPRPGYKLPEPNGCSSSLVGFQVNAALSLGIPAMTQCCNQLDTCYDTCGTSKYDCDSSFRNCLHRICFDLKKSLGFGMQVQTCESMADGLFNTVWTLGCRPYMNSQRTACICHGEEKDEL